MADIATRPLSKRTRRWIIIAAVVGLAILVAVVTRSVTQRARQARHDAWQSKVQTFMSKGEYSAAAKVADAWRSAEPKSADAVYWKVRTDVALDRVEEIEKDFQQAKTLGNSAERLEFLRALVAAKMKKYGEAEPPLSRAFRQNQGPDPQLDEALARVYLENFDIPNAMAVLAKWMKDQPENPTPYLWRAEADTRGEVSFEALEDDYREALKRDPKLAKARLGLAELLQKQHRDAAARGEFAAYLQLRPDDPKGHLGAGRAARGSGDEQAAETHFRRALQLAPKNAAAHGEFADAALALHKPDRALSNVDIAIAIDPFEPRYHYTRALALKSLGRDADAAKEQAVTAKLRADLERLTTLRRYLVQHPDDVATQVEMARWMFHHGQPKGGIDWAEKILRQHPNQPEANRLLAEHYTSVGNEALANFYRLRGENPSP